MISISPRKLILYTFILGETKKFKLLKLKESDFKICVEIPINVKNKRNSYTTISSHERSRFKGKKKVNEIIDGFKILFYLIKKFLSKKV